MENFIVSARKYRPATFASVVGQSHITTTLRNAISRGQLAHAYLFCGPRGVGKTTCARIFAKAINCSSPVVGGDGQKAGFEACGQCESCKSFDEGRSFNIHELDAASNNSVEDIRSLTDQVRIPPQVGRYSVYIIDEVHMLSAAAFNAFLKTLEEPPAHAVFILATTEKHKIIPTILSRCQVFDFNRIRVADGVEYMRYIADTEGVKCDEESLNLIARKADGGMRDALSMFDKAVSFCGTELRYKDVAASLNILDYDTYFTAVNIVLAGDYPEALMLLDRVLGQGFSAQTFMTGLGGHLRDLLVAGNPKTTALLDLTGGLTERYAEQASRCRVDFLFGGIALLAEVDGRIRTSSNQRLVVELALMKLCTLAVPTGVAAGAGAAEAEKKNCDRAANSGAAVNSGAGATELSATGMAGEPATVAADGCAAGTTDGSAAPVVGRGLPSTAGTDVMEGRLSPEVALPPLKSGAAKVGAPSANSPAAPAPAPNIASVQPSPAHNTPPAASATNSAPAVAVSTSPASAPAPPPAPEAAAPPAPFTSAISGRTLSEIMVGGTAEQTAAPEQHAAQIDPDAERKIAHHREKFLASLTRERPRIGVAFETMEVSGNGLTVRVASQTLHDEIVRWRTETLLLLATVAGVHGPIELDVIVDETVKPLRPIRLEDKIRHLAELNPEFNALRKAFEMEIE